MLRFKTFAMFNFALFYCGFIDILRFKTFAMFKFALFYCGFIVFSHIKFGNVEISLIFSVFSTIQFGKPVYLLCFLRILEKSNGGVQYLFWWKSAAGRSDFLHVLVCARTGVRKGDPQQQVLWEKTL